MNRNYYVLFAMAILVISIGVSAQAQNLSYPYTVYGYVYKSDGITPQAGVTVNITNLNTSEYLLATTFSDGSWIQNLGNLNSGYNKTQILRVYANYSEYSGSFSALVGDSSPQYLGDVVLGIPPNGGDGNGDPGPFPGIPCVFGELRCSGDNLFSCNEEKEWVLKENCTYGCDPETLFCITTPVKCTPGELKCSGDDLLICNEKSIWVTNQTCEYGCSNNTCNSQQVQLCIPGETRCSGNDIQECNSFGDGWKFKETCEYGCFKGECNPKPGEYDWSTMMVGVYIIIILLIIVASIVIYMKSVKRRKRKVKFYKRFYKKLKKYMKIFKRK